MNEGSALDLVIKVLLLVAVSAVGLMVTRLLKRIDDLADLGERMTKLEMKIEALERKLP